MFNLIDFYQRKLPHSFIILIIVPQMCSNFHRQPRISSNTLPEQVGVCGLDKEVLYTQTLLGLVRGLPLSKKLKLLELHVAPPAVAIPCMPPAVTYKCSEEVHPPSPSPLENARAPNFTPLTVYSQVDMLGAWYGSGLLESASRQRSVCVVCEVR
jgi:hypothetical protein